MDGTSVGLLILPLDQRKVCKYIQSSMFLCNLVNENPLLGANRITLFVGERNEGNRIQLRRCLYETNALQNTIVPIANSRRANLFVCHI